MESNNETYSANNREEHDKRINELKEAGAKEVANMLIKAKIWLAKGDNGNSIAALDMELKNSNQIQVEHLGLLLTQQFLSRLTKDSEGSMEGVKIKLLKMEIERIIDEINTMLLKEFEKNENS